LWSAPFARTTLVWPRTRSTTTSSAANFPFKLFYFFQAGLHVLLVYHCCSLFTVLFVLFSRLF
jgi:hypothetical protein